VVALDSAARIITNTGKYDSGLLQILHDELHWLDVADQVQFKLTVLMYQYLHCISPRYLMDSFTLTVDVTGHQHLWFRQSASQRKLIILLY